MSETGSRDNVRTLEHYLQGTAPEIVKVYLAIAQSALRLSDELPFHTGMTGGVNPSGDQQAQLDVFSNDLFCDSLLATGVVGQVASEEMEQPRESGPLREHGLSVAMDPLDGSSNIATNNPLGSIFGIWRGPLPQPGKSLLASLFVTYGPTLTLTLTAGKKVAQFVAVRSGPHRGSYVLANDGMVLPDTPEVYGIGGERGKWTPRVEAFVQTLEKRGMKLRYGGTFIGDFNQVLKRGGLFAYPELTNKPHGKLRVLYESAPVGFLAELAGGASSDGRRSLLEVEPRALAETSPCYVGSRGLLRELQSAFVRA